MALCCARNLKDEASVVFKTILKENVRSLEDLQGLLNDDPRVALGIGVKLRNVGGFMNALDFSVAKTSTAKFVEEELSD